MGLKAQQVFRSLDPYRAVSDLKLPLHQENNIFITVHPKTKTHRMQIAKSEFVGMDYTCPTPACNVFDFLALHFGSYDRAVDYAIESYHNLAQIPTGVTLASIRGPMIDSLKDERLQFEEILSLQQPLRMRESRLTNAFLYCRRYGLSLDHVWRVIYATQGLLLNKILHYSPTHVEAFPAANTYLIFPFFKNRHTFAMLQVHDTNGKLIRTIELNPTKASFFGLHSCLPGTDQVQVYEKPLDVTSMHSYAVQNGKFRTGFVSVGFNPSAEMDESPLKAGVFMNDTDTDFNTLVKHRFCFDDFFIADYKRRYSESLNTEPWHVYSLNTMVRMLNQAKDVTPKISMYLESLKGDHKVCSQLIYYMEQCKQFDTIERIKRHVDTHHIFTIGSMHIRETVNGYVAKKVGTNASSHFTNFLIKIDVKIWFEDTEETFYSGRIILNGSQVPFLVSSVESRQVKTLILRIEQAVQRAGLMSEVNYPIVTDTTLTNRLMDVINQQTDNKPRRVGVQHLGWNVHKNRFITPGWEAYHMGVRNTSKVIHPDSTQISKYFTVDDYPIVTATDKVTPQARYLISLVVASMTRAFLNQQTPTTMLVRSPHSMALLAAVFRPLGQVIPLELNPNRRIVMDTLSARNFDGYPIYATCPDLSAIDNFNFPLFILSDSGYPMHEPVSLEAAEQITSLAHRIFGALVVEFSKDRMLAHGLIEQDEAPAIEQLALEGKRVIEARCGIPQFDLFEPSLPIFQAVLSNTASDKCNEMFRYDLQTNQVFIRCRLIKSVTTRQPLFEELLAKNSDVKLHSDHYIACPADWFKDLLAKFYGRSITLYHQAADASVPPTEVQDGSQSSGTC